MAGGDFIRDGPRPDHGGRLTAPVMITSIMAEFGGVIFGYALGISGGITAMESFLQTFFPDIMRKMADAKRSCCLVESFPSSARPSTPPP
ncbi:hypothetical protein OPV22_026130 [Ensete ventricosum]|uniref:Uncharacterized protein n=1 Tax=Ensete ventricosum TaxID=4639 RepID=A0AAV8Q9V0_ENSVE|nr:hypothetical protein OPV22_026130 [Ensete ventricosum]